MRTLLAILVALPLLAPGGALAQQGGTSRPAQGGGQGGSQACEAAFRRCNAECGGGPSGSCTMDCFTERARCIQNPSRPRTPSQPQR